MVSVNKILIVDDENSIREALKIYFNNKGFEAETAKNGRDAIEYIEKEDFDVIVSDIRMDKLDGLSLLKKIKEYNKKIPVILITAFADLNGAIEALRGGAFEYIIKPFNMETIAEKVDSALKTARNTSEERLAKKYEEEKLDFISKFSNELKTPLTPVYGFISLMLKKEFGEIPPSQLDVIRNIHKNSIRLKRIIDDLIMIYYIDYLKEKPFLKNIEILKLVEETLKEKEDLIKRKNQRVEIKIYDEIDTIYCDIEKMKRVIFHLIDNAIKFSPVTSIILIEICNYEYKGQPYIKFSIKDNSERLKVNKRIIFNQFYELANNTDDPTIEKEIHGMGIGLTLSKSIIESHNGKIWIEDDSNIAFGGNTFSFIIPVINEKDKIL